VSITSFASVVLVARVLGVEGAGLVAFAVWIIFTGAIVANPGAPTTLARYLPELRTIDEKSAEAFGVVVLRTAAVIAAPAMIIIFGLIVWLSGTMSPLTAGLVAMMVGLQILSTNYSAYLKGLQQFYEMAAVTIKSSLLQLATIVVGLFTLGLNGALLGYLAGTLLPAALACRLLFRRVEVRRRLDSPDLRRRVFRFSSLNWGLSVISAVVWYRAELFFLKVYHGPGAVGLFSVGLTLANIATMFPALLLGALLPHFSQQISRNEIEELQATYTRFTRLVAFLVFPICFGLAAVCPVLVPLLYGTAFAPAVPSAMLVVGGASIGVAVATNSNLLLGFERTHVLFVTNIVGMVLMLIMGVTVIPRWGIEGAAWSRVFVQIAIVSMEFCYVIFRLNIKVPIRALSGTLLAACVCAISAYAIVRELGGTYSLFVGVPAGAIIYVVMVRLLRVLQSDDKERLEELVRKLPRPLHGALLRVAGIVIPAGRGAAP